MTLTWSIQVQLSCCDCPSPVVVLAAGSWLLPPVLPHPAQPRGRAGCCSDCWSQLSALLDWGGVSLYLC